jgi:hypothetical protein
MFRNMIFLSYFYTITNERGEYEVVINIPKIVHIYQLTKQMNRKTTSTNQKESGRCCLRAVAVSHEVGRSLHVRNFVGTGIGQDLGSEGGGGEGVVRGEELGAGSAHLGGGHGGPGDGVGGGGRADPGGGDGGAGAEDINTGAVVGVTGTVVVDVGGSDSDSQGLGGGGVRAGIGVVVTGSDNHGDTAVGGGRDGVVLDLREASAKGQVGDGLAASDGGAASHPVDAINHTRSGAGASVAEHLHGDQVGLLGSTPGLSSNGTGAMGTVAIAISLIGDADSIGDTGVSEGARAGLLVHEVVVLAVDTGINHIGIHVNTRSTSGVVIGVSLTGVVVSDIDSGSTPILAGLRLAVVERHGLVFLDELDLLVLEHALKTTGGQLDSVGRLVVVSHVLEDMEGLEVTGEGLVHHLDMFLEGNSVEVIVHTDDVRVDNLLGGMGFAQVSAGGDDGEGGNDSFLHVGNRAKKLFRSIKL